MLMEASPASSALAHSLNSQETTAPCLTQTAAGAGLAGTGKAVSASVGM